MANNKNVLIVGIDPFLIDFSSPEFAAFPGLTAQKVEVGVKDSIQQLNEAGYATELCWIDFGATAASILEKKIKQHDAGIILIGAGIRVPEKNFLLFEKLLNVINEHSTNAKICFNTNPGDTVVAIERCAVA